MDPLLCALPRAACLSSLTDRLPPPPRPRPAPNEIVEPSTPRSAGGARVFERQTLLRRLWSALPPLPGRRRVIFLMLFLTAIFVAWNTAFGDSPHLYNITSTSAKWLQPAPGPTEPQVVSFEPSLVPRVPPFARPSSATVAPFREFVNSVSSPGCVIPTVIPDPFMRPNAPGDPTYETFGDDFPKFDWDPKLPKFSFLNESTLTIVCSSLAKYLELPYGANPSLNLMWTPPPEALEYSSPLRLRSDTEIVHTYCSMGGHWVRQWHYHLIYNATQLDRARSRRPLARSEPKNPNVAYILTDAFAHGTFRRGMPVTLDYLHHLNTSGLYEVFEFELYHVVGWHSDRNTAPFILGAFDADYRADIQRLGSAANVPNPPPCNQSLYGYYEEKGYLTLNLDAECHVWPLGPLRYLSLGFGEVACKRATEELVDFVPSRQVGCGVQATNGWRPDVHPRWATPFLSAATRIAQLYRDHPLFSVIYLLEAHMSSMGGFVKQEFDVPFVSELERMEREGVLHRTLTFIAADHGLHFGPHLETHEGQTEHKLPAFYLIAPRWWLRERPGAADALRHNQRALITAFDIHRTLKHILTYPAPAPEVNYRLSRPALSLLERIPVTRTCDDAGIPPELCVCENAGWDELSMTSPLDTNAQAALNAAISYFNGRARNVSASCAQVSIQSVTQLKRKGFFKGYQKEYVQGQLFKAQLTVAPKSAGRSDFPLLEAVVWQRGSGGWRLEATVIDQFDIHYVHRLTGATQAEKDVGKKFAEYCIVA